MTLRPRQFAAIAVAAFCALALACGRACAAEPRLTPLAVDVVSAPAPVTGSDGRRHLVYELRIDNRSGGEFDLKTIDVIDPASGAVLLELDRSEIAKRFAIGGSRGAESADLGLAQFGVLFVHVALPPGEPAPRALTHRIAGYFAKTGADFTMSGGEAAVSSRRPAVLGPPLLGAGYVAADGCCDSVRHVRALLTIDGRLALAQRFAIDWEEIDAEGRVVSGDLKALGSYMIFGKSVLAVDEEP